MASAFNQIIYTIGHSSRSLEEFISMLQSFSVKYLVDIRRFPNSGKYPHFNKQHLELYMPEHNIKYAHIEQLGGRRQEVKDSLNNRWRNASFRGYADYIQTQEFKSAIGELEKIAEKETTAFMCSEAVWWRCHRSMVSDYLKAKGWDVEHIMAVNKIEEHPYTSPARIVNGKVFYHDENSINFQTK